MATSLMRRNLFDATEPFPTPNPGWSPICSGFSRFAVVTPPNTVYSEEWRRNDDPFRFPCTLGWCLLAAA